MQIRRTIPGKTRVILARWCVAAALAFGAYMIVRSAAQEQPSEPAMIALPRIAVSFDETGVPTIAGVSARLIEVLSFGALPARAVSIDRAWIEYFQSTDVQHIEVLQNDEGVFAWINGRRMPNVAWSRRELHNSAQLAERLGALELLGLSPNASSFLQRSAPVLRRLALNVVLRFPTRPGVAEIATRDTATPVSALPRRPKAAPERTIAVGVRYDDQGDPWPTDISDSEFRSRVGFDVMNLALEPDFVARLSGRGLRSMAIRSEEDGIALRVNGVSLPALQCNAQCLVDLGDIVATLNTYPETEHLNAPIRTLTPALRGIDASVTLEFPIPAHANAVAHSSR